MEIRCQSSSDRSTKAEGHQRGYFFSLLTSRMDREKDQPLTVLVDPFPLADVLLCSRCKLSVRNSMGRRAEGGTVGARIDSVLRTVSVVSPPAV
jgi:hypothetical protein